jgi:endonuclease YncB( thermonuclease family)
MTKSREEQTIYTYRITIKKVIDGDSFRADLDLGLDNWKHDVNFRLFAVDTPETKALKGDKELKRFGITVSDWVKTQVIVGEKYWVKTFKDKRGKFGRPMIKLYHKGKNQRCLNDELVYKGFAVPYYGQSKDLVTDLHRKNMKRFVKQGGELAPLKRSKKV